MADEYGPDIISVEDEQGVEHEFELLDSIDTDDEHYVALTPVYSDAEEIIDDDGELIILKVSEENGDSYLEPIEDEDEFEAIAAQFEERLSGIYDIKDADE